MNQYITWNELIPFVYENTGIKYSRDNVHGEHYGLSIDGKLPYSISEYEFNYMKDFIVEHNLKSGYELATGTCLSTVALGLGFKETGGKLISLDSYIEYETQTIPISKSFGPTDSKLFSQNQSLLDLYQLDNVELKIGWSPQDAEKYLPDVVDFVFLDCPKTIEDFIRDIGPVKSRLATRFAIFIHDVFAYPPEAFNKHAVEILGIHPKYISSFYDKYNQTFPLTVVTNL